MKFIELKKAESINDTIFVYIDETELRTDFDTDKTKVKATYYKGPEAEGDKQADITLTLSDIYISDTYHLTGVISEDSKVRACLDAAKAIFDDKGVPDKYSGAIFMSQHPIIYTERPNMQANR